MFRWLPVCLVLLAWTSWSPAQPTVPQKKTENKESVLPKGVPAKVGRVLKIIDDTGEAPQGYVGGRNFGNYEKRLPRYDKKGKTIRYQEWDVNPKIQGKNRGAERLITGSDGSAHFTSDHYKTFTKIR